MCGGNPKHDAYGFRHWQGSSAFAQQFGSDKQGGFEGFLGALWEAAFCVVGPEYVSMIAGEAVRPSIHVKTAFKVIYWRMAIFFVGSCLAVGTIIAYNDPTFVAFLSSAQNSSSVSASPYLIAMQNLGIRILPSVVCALLVTTIFSAGNTYVYAATRTLHSLAEAGHAPKQLRYCTKNGVPIYCLLVVVLCFPLISLIQLSSSSARALAMLLQMITPSGLINFIVICITYLQFHKACKVQGVDRSKLPYCGRFQPYCGWIALVWMILILILQDYTALYPWSTMEFFIHYAMVIFAVCLFFGWKLLKKTRFVRPCEMDLVWEGPAIDAYEASFQHPPIGFWREVLQMFGFGGRNNGHKERAESLSA